MPEVVAALTSQLASPVVPLPTAPELQYSYAIVPFLLLEAANVVSVRLQLTVLSKVNSTTLPLQADLAAGSNVTVALEAAPYPSGAPTTSLSFSGVVPAPSATTFMTLTPEPMSPPFPFSLASPSNTITLSALTLQSSSQAIPAARGCNKLLLLTNTCPAGYGLQTVSGTPTCQRCPTGTISRGATVNAPRPTCTPCPAGTASTTAQDACTPCPDGQWSLQGQASCWSCPIPAYPVKVPGPLPSSTALLQFNSTSLGFDILLYLAALSQKFYMVALRPSAMLPGNTSPLQVTLLLRNANTGTTYTYSTRFPAVTDPSAIPPYIDLAPASPLPYSPSASPTSATLEATSITTTTVLSPLVSNTYLPINTCNRMRIILSACPPGYGTLTASGSGCTICPAGTISAGGTVSNPQPRCQPCPPGSYSPQAGSTQCTDCYWAVPLGQNTLEAEAICGRCPAATPVVPLSNLRANPLHLALYTRSQNFTIDIIADASSSSFQVALLPLGSASQPCRVTLDVLVGPLQTPLQFSTPPGICTNIPSLTTWNTSWPTLLTPSTTPSPLPLNLSAPLDPSYPSGTSSITITMVSLTLHHSSLHRPMALLPWRGCPSLTLITNTCPAGHGVSSPGQASCGTCQPGTFSAGGTASNPKPECTSCPAGTYATTTGAASCTTCAAGTASVGADIACTVCPPAAIKYPLWGLQPPGPGAALPPTLQATSGTTTWNLYITQDHPQGLLRVATAPDAAGDLAARDSVQLRIQVPTSNVIQLSGRATAADISGTLQLMANQPWRLSQPSASSAPSTVLVQVLSITVVKAVGGSITTLVPNRGCNKVLLVTNGCSAGYGGLADGPGMVKCQKCEEAFYSPGGSGLTPKPACQPCGQGSTSTVGAAACSACSAAPVKVPYSPGQVVQDNPHVRLRVQQGSFNINFLLGSTADGEVELQAILTLPTGGPALVQPGDQMGLQASLNGSLVASFAAAAAVPAGWVLGDAVILTAADTLQPVVAGGATASLKALMAASATDATLLEVLAVVVTRASTPTSYPPYTGCVQVSLLLGACPAGFGVVAGGSICQRCGVGSFSPGGTVSIPKPPCQACASVTSSLLTSINDPSNCGACGNACQLTSALSNTTGATDVCLDGSCSTVFDATSPYVQCQGAVVSRSSAFLSDVNNCGGCGTLCTAATQLPPGVADDVCQAGVCVLTYRTGWQLCEGRLVNTAVDFLEDISNCGACGNACGLAAGQPAGAAVDVCVAGVCGVRAAVGWEMCGGALKQTFAAYLSDANNCGWCGRQCTVVGSGAPAGAAAAAVCVSGVCNVTAAAGWAFCGGKLVSVATAYSGDPLNCGACGNVCSLPGGYPAGSVDSVVCQNGSCLVKLAPDWEYCNGTLVLAPAAFISDANNCGACGNKCNGSNIHAAGAVVDVCMQGVCSTTPSVGWEQCGAGYKHLTAGYLSDVSNCGRCGVQCTTPSNAPTGAAAAAVCMTGVCNVTAAPGWEWCGGNLVQLSTAYQSDVLNCGACGVRCNLAATYANESAARDVCSSGVCSVALGAGSWQACSGDLVNARYAFQSNTGSCGTCETVCNMAASLPAGSTLSNTCSSGRCSVTPAASYALCNGRFVSLLTNVNHCSSCGNACQVASVAAGGLAGTDVCSAGFCEWQCQPGYYVPYNASGKQWPYQCEPAVCYLRIQGNPYNVSLSGSLVEWNEVMLQYPASNGTLYTLRHPLVQVDRSSVWAGAGSACVDGNNNTVCSTANQTTSVAYMYFKYPCRYNITRVTLVGTSTTIQLANLAAMSTWASNVPVGSSNSLTLYTDPTGGLPPQTLDLRSLHNDFSTTAFAWDIYSCAILINYTRPSYGDAHLSFAEVELYANDSATSIPFAELQVTQSSTLGPAYAAPYCFNGNYSDLCHTNAPSVEAAAGLLGTPVLRIQYNCSYQLDTVKVYNRGDSFANRTLAYTMWSLRGPYAPVPSYVFAARVPAQTTVPYTWALNTCALKINMTQPAYGSDSQLHLAEVELYANGSASKIPTANLTTAISSALYAFEVENCFDGSPGSICHSQATSVAVAAGMLGETWLSAQYPCKYQVDTVKILNRADCCSDRIKPYGMWLLRGAYQLATAGPYQFSERAVQTTDRYTWAVGSCALLISYTGTVDNPLNMAEVELYPAGSATKIALSAITFDSSPTFDSETVISNCYDGNFSSSCSTTSPAQMSAAGLTPKPFIQFQYPCSYDVGTVKVYNRLDTSSFCILEYTMWNLRPGDARPTQSFAFNSMQYKNNNSDPYIWNPFSCHILINYTSPASGTGDGDSVLNLMEVELYAAGSGTKIASSELNVTSSTSVAGWYPSYAVDSDLVTMFQSDTPLNERTAGMAGSPFFKVEYPCSYNLTRVKVWNRPDNPERLKAYTMWSLQPGIITAPQPVPSFRFNALAVQTTEPYIWDIYTCSVFINYTSPAYGNGDTNAVVNLLEVELYPLGSGTKIPSSELVANSSSTFGDPAITGPAAVIDGNYSTRQSTRSAADEASAGLLGFPYLSVQYPCSYSLGTVKVYPRSGYAHRIRPFTMWSLRGPYAPLPAPSYPFYRSALKVDDGDPYIWEVARCSVLASYTGPVSNSSSKFLAMSALALYNTAGTRITVTRMAMSTTAAVGLEAANCNAEPAAAAATPACQTKTVGQEATAKLLGRPFLEATHSCSEVVGMVKVWTATSYPTALWDFEMRLVREGFPTATSINISNMGTVRGLYTWWVSV